MWVTHDPGAEAGACACAEVWAGYTDGWTVWTAVGAEVVSLGLGSIVELTTGHATAAGCSSLPTVMRRNRSRTPAENIGGGLEFA
jgi:hypothetical protein